jgi:hypothetical protein
MGMPFEWSLQGEDLVAVEVGVVEAVSVVVVDLDTEVVVAIATVVVVVTTVIEVTTTVVAVEDATVIVSDPGLDPLKDATVAAGLQTEVVAPALQISESW